jgi:hypothetical protein
VTMCPTTKWFMNGQAKLHEKKINAITRLRFGLKWIWYIVLAISFILCCIAFEICLPVTVIFTSYLNITTSHRSLDSAVNMRGDAL